MQDRASVFEDANDDAIHISFRARGAGAKIDGESCPLHESQPQPSRLRKRQLSPRTQAFAVAYCKRPVSRPMYGSSTYICRSVSSEVQQAAGRICCPVRQELIISDLERKKEKNHAIVDV